MIILKSVFPVFILIIAGKILKDFNITSDEFHRVSDKLIYYFFFPIMLFWKIGNKQATTEADLYFCLAGVCAVLVMFVISTVYIKLFKV